MASEQTFSEWYLAYCQANKAARQQFAPPAQAPAIQAPEAVAEPMPNGEPWDQNPDGIRPGQDSGPRMDPHTGMWHVPGGDDEDALADAAVAAARTPGDSVPGVSTAALVRATARAPLTTPSAAVSAGPAPADDFKARLMATGRVANFKPDGTPALAPTQPQQFNHLNHEQTK